MRIKAKPGSRICLFVDTFVPLPSFFKENQGVFNTLKTTKITEETFLGDKIFRTINNNDGRGLKEKTESYGVTVNTLTVDFTDINST